MLKTIQASFVMGEISPDLYGRSDMAGYKAGLATLKNFILHPQGGASNAPGTYFIGEVKNSNKKTILIPFVYNAAHSFILEFNESGYMRVIKAVSYTHLTLPTN